MDILNSKQYLLSNKLDRYFTGVHKAYVFTLRFFKEIFKKPFHHQELINQSFVIGLKSLPLISLTGFVVGVVFTQQSRPALEDFGATSWLPSLIGIAVIRALAPMVTALICAGKVGSSISAELGSMKVTEQIEAMEVSAINPFKYLVSTRVMATTITVPLLTMYCILVALIGSYFNVHSNEAISFMNFMRNAFSAISFLDFFTALIKSIVYGFTIGMVGSYKGFHATQGTRGVGKAANEAVVLAMFIVFIEEVVIVQISNWIIYF